MPTACPTPAYLIQIAAMRRSRSPSHTLHPPLPQHFAIPKMTGWLSPVRLNTLAWGRAGNELAVLGMGSDEAEEVAGERLSAG